MKICCGKGLNLVYLSFTTKSTKEKPVMELKQLSAKIKVKYNQFSQRYRSGFDRPKQKFLRQMILGI